MMRMLRTLARVTALGALALVLPLAGAQELKGPVKIVVGYAPGGASDLVARAIADRLRVSLGVPVVVENKVGAGGRLSAEAVKNANPAEGVTLLAGNPAIMVVAPAVYPKLPYDPQKDFVGVAHAANYYFSLAVPTGLGVTDMKGLAAWLKANPQKAAFGSPASGSLPHFFGLMIGGAIGVEMAHVAYRGSAPLTSDLVGGQIPVAIDTADAQAEMHRAGRIRVLGVSSAQRMKAFPDLPTFREQGYDIEGIGFNAFFAPAGTPKAAVERVGAAIVEALRDPELRARFEKMGMEPTGFGPAETDRVVAAFRARWVPVIQASGYKPVD